MRKFLYIILILFSAALVSCEKPDVDEDPKLVASLLANSFDTVEIGSKYILETDLSRDFMPSYPHKRPLVAVAILVNLDSLTIPSNIDITKLYVLNDQYVWTSFPKALNPLYQPDFKKYKVSNDGPEWEVNILVDVVAEVIDKSNNNKFLIIARNQIIQRLD